MSRKKTQKPYDEMTAEELAEATAAFDKEFVIDQSRDQTPGEAAEWARARRKRGRPRQGRGVKVISVSLEKGLLEDTDRLARRLKVRRTELISRGLQAVLRAEAASKNPAGTAANSR